MRSECSSADQGAAEAEGSHAVDSEKEAIVGKLPNLSFFATGEDLRPLQATLESRHDIRYAECGLFDEKLRPTITRLSSLSLLSGATAGDSNKEPTYLVIGGGSAVHVRAVPQKRGGTKFAAD